MITEHNLNCLHCTVIDNMKQLVATPPPFFHRTNMANLSLIQNRTY